MVDGLGKDDKFEEDFEEDGGEFEFGMEEVGEGGEDIV